MARRRASRSRTTRNGPDILDRNKALFAPGVCGRSEDTFDDAEGAFLANINGPVRAIRSYIGANSGPYTERTHIFYAQREDIVTDLRVHPIPGVMSFFDYSNAAIGMQYTNDRNLAGVPIDGVPDTVAAGRQLVGESRRYARRAHARMDGGQRRDAGADHDELLRGQRHEPDRPVHRRRRRHRVERPAQHERHPEHRPTRRTGRQVREHSRAVFRGRGPLDGRRAAPRQPGRGAPHGRRCRLLGLGKTAHRGPGNRIRDRANVPRRGGSVWGLWVVLPFV